MEQWHLEQGREWIGLVATAVVHLMVVVLLGLGAISPRRAAMVVLLLEVVPWKSLDRVNVNGHVRLAAFDALSIEHLHKVSDYIDFQRLWMLGTLYFAFAYGDGGPGAARREPLKVDEDVKISSRTEKVMEQSTSGLVGTEPSKRITDRVLVQDPTSTPSATNNDDSTTHINGPTKSSTQQRRSLPRRTSFKVVYSHNPADDEAAWKNATLFLSKQLQHTLLAAQRTVDHAHVHPVLHSQYMHFVQSIAGLDAALENLQHIAWQIEHFEPRYELPWSESHTVKRLVKPMLFDAGELMERVAEMLANIVNDKGMELVVDCPDYRGVDEDVFLVIGDEDYTRQILLQILFPLIHDAPEYSCIELLLRTPTPYLVKEDPKQQHGQQQLPQPPPDAPRIFHTKITYEIHYQHDDHTHKRPPTLSPYMSKILTEMHGEYQHTTTSATGTTITLSFEMDTVRYRDDIGTVLNFPVANSVSMRSGAAFRHWIRELQGCHVGVLATAATTFGWNMVRYLESWGMEVTYLVTEQIELFAGHLEEWDKTVEAAYRHSGVERYSPASEGGGVSSSSSPTSASGGNASNSNASSRERQVVLLPSLIFIDDDFGTLELVLQHRVEHPELSPCLVVYMTSLTNHARINEHVNKSAENWGDVMPQVYVLTKPLGVRKLMVAMKWMLSGREEEEEDLEQERRRGEERRSAKRRSVATEDRLMNGERRPRSAALHSRASDPLHQHHSHHQHQHHNHHHHDHPTAATSTHSNSTGTTQSSTLSNKGSTPSVTSSTGTSATVTGPSTTTGGGAGGSSSSAATKPAIPPIRVLIAEDNPINQTILATFLKKRGIKAVVANNGQEALDRYKAEKFHLILMDIVMPVMDGIQATREIREMERRRVKERDVRGGIRNSPFAENENGGGGESSVGRSTEWSEAVIIALTASSLPADRDAALKAGCNDYLIKPVSLVWLQRKIMEWGQIQALIDFRNVLDQQHQQNLQNQQNQNQQNQKQIQKQEGSRRGTPQPTKPPQTQPQPQTQTQPPNQSQNQAPSSSALSASTPSPTNPTTKPGTNVSDTTTGSGGSGGSGGSTSTTTTGGSGGDSHPTHINLPNPSSDSTTSQVDTGAGAGAGDGGILDIPTVMSPGSTTDGGGV
ncbi:ssk1 response regulator receiver [Gaertneriomyces sp. JEL0708]|nr:ssk1 response regulator receiver [Gaertneriomyces sp. JEL0708]